MITIHDYVTYITNHENYNFIPEEHKRNWVSVSKNGENARKQFWDKKQAELIQLGKISRESSLVNVARFIHPTKKHVCKKCNKECSIYYEYPTANTWKWLEKTFKIEKNDLTIFQIYNQIINPNKHELFFLYFGVYVNQLETLCKNDQYSGNKLSPGVMGNPPDRLDGFHCYNSCCRSKHDKGRSDENMKSYTRDRRAYEYFSDGNCLLANCLMGKLNTVITTCFMCNKNAEMTADHIGPISLGFIHDPLNFQACCGPCNSKKNNRMTQTDLNKLKLIEEGKVNLTSWWAKNAWEKCKNDDVNKVIKILNQNTKKFLCVLQWLKNNKSDVLETFINESYMNHDNSYNIHTIEVSNGDIKFEYTETKSVKATKGKQINRTKEILLEVNDKTKRKIKVCLTDDEIRLLSDINKDNFKNKISSIL